METLVSLKGKKIFVTGHTGFKGAWLTLWLEQLGASVCGYALAPNTNPSLFDLLKDRLKCQSIIGDIRDKLNLKNAILAFDPDIVFHLAAQPLVRVSYLDPVSTWDTNVTGTVHVLDAVRYLNGPRQIVVITTDKVYENNQWDYPYREIDRLGGHDPYSASKAAAELAVDSFRRSFFSSESGPVVATARAGNVIGGGDWASDRLIPDLIRAFSNDTPLSIRYPNAIRPWQHVLEPLLGYIMLAVHLAKYPSQFSTAWNFGPRAEDHLDVKDMVTIAKSKWGKGNVRDDAVPNQLHEAGILKLDISKTTSQLNWTPRWTATQSIERTLSWYTQFLKAPDRAFDLCLGDLNGYLNG